MDRNSILDLMEKKAEAIVKENSDYHARGKRGMLVISQRDQDNPDQWDSSCRSFGTIMQDFGHEGEMVINNGTSFDALVHGKVAYTRRTKENSGTNYYQVLGSESFWKGALISGDGNCICAFSGLKGADDVAIAQAGIDAYEAQKG